MKMKVFISLWTFLSLFVWRADASQVEKYSMQTDCIVQSEHHGEFQFRIFHSQKRGLRKLAVEIGEWSILDEPAPTVLINGLSNKGDTAMDEIHLTFKHSSKTFEIETEAMSEDAVVVITPDEVDDDENPIEEVITNNCSMQPQILTND